jgi:hypothetical protein
MTKTFYFRVKTQNGSEFEYEQDTSYPTISAIGKGKTEDNRRENLINSIKEIIMMLEASDE